MLVSRTRESVHEAPRYNPELTYERDYHSDLYGYYGVLPYWGAGYVYPGYPYYRP